MNSTLPTLSSIVLALLVCIGAQSLAAGQGTISIVAPSGDTTVSPGQTIEADIQSTFDIVVLGCDPPLQCAPLSANNGISRWSVLVPINITAGNYSIQAGGNMTTNKVTPTLSNSITLSVTPSTAPSALVLSPGFATFKYIGDQRYFRVLAQLGNGSSIDVSADPHTSITTSPNLSRVGTRYTAQASGNGSINASYTANGTTISKSLTVSIPQALPGDLNGDGRVDTDDLNILLGFKNHPASGPSDARDLNHDGKIDALDARILTTLCTYPRCATHP